MATANSKTPTRPATGADVMGLKAALASDAVESPRRRYAKAEQERKGPACGRINCGSAAK